MVEERVRAVWSSSSDTAERGSKNMQHFCFPKLTILEGTVQVKLKSGVFKATLHMDVSIKSLQLHVRMGRGQDEEKSVENK